MSPQTPQSISHNLCTGILKYCKSESEHRSLLQFFLEKIQIFTFHVSKEIKIHL